MFYKRKVYYVLMGFFYFFSISIVAQDQQIADSLAKIYQADTTRG